VNAALLASEHGMYVSGARIGGPLCTCCGVYRMYVLYNSVLRCLLYAADLASCMHIITPRRVIIIIISLHCHDNVPIYSHATPICGPVAMVMEGYFMITPV
jgi:hypothetical protein